MKHILSGNTWHYTWDASHTPLLTIQSGDTVTFELPDCAGGHITFDSTHDALHTEFDTNPLLGPVFIEDAKPGDVLAIDVVECTPHAQGWTAIFPNFGVLSEEFAEPFLHHVSVYDGQCHFTDSIALPMQPFCGEMGIAPADTVVSTALPGRFGGNLDMRYLTAGARLLLPIQCEGGLFSCGDGHAMQGAGEVNGTGVEIGMTAVFRFEVLKDVSFALPRCTYPERIEVPRVSFLAHGVTVEQATEAVLHEVIAALVHKLDISPELAYCLCGAAVDIRIDQLVNEPAIGVSAHVPATLLQ